MVIINRVNQVGCGEQRYFSVRVSAMCIGVSVLQGSLPVCPEGENETGNESQKSMVLEKW
jgi:hypothetical protein